MKGNRSSHMPRSEIAVRAIVAERLTDCNFDIENSEHWRHIRFTKNAAYLILAI